MQMSEYSLVCMQTYPGNFYTSKAPSVHCILQVDKKAQLCFCGVCNCLWALVREYNPCLKKLGHLLARCFTVAHLVGFLPFYVLDRCAGLACRKG